MEYGKKISRVLAVCAIGLPLAACLTTTKEVDQLSQVESEGDRYDRALTREYNALAQYEAWEMYDWGDARKFAVKGLEAAEGARPVPERVDDWTLAYGEKRLSDARKRLAALLARDAAGRSPDLAARAQASFDCWVEQMEEGWQLDHIAACHSGFQRSVISLERELSEPQRIWFGFNRAEPNATMQSEIERLAAESKRLNAPLVSVVGFADTVGSRKSNMKLSIRRADAVKRLLMEHGIPEDRIAVSAYGETRQKMATGDNVREAQNRRVEIIFYPQIDV